MNKQIYQQNVFLQKSKDKFNPDVLKKKESEDKNRLVSVFKKSNVTYNSITNQSPEIIKSQKDLQLNKDDPIKNIDKLIIQKIKERDDQYNINIPQKQKILPNEYNEDNKISLEDFNELKLEQKEYLNKQKKVIEINKNKYEDIMVNLKKLGIVNNI